MSPLVNYLDSYQDELTRPALRSPNDPPGWELTAEAKQRRKNAEAFRLDGGIKITALQRGTDDPEPVVSIEMVLSSTWKNADGVWHVESIFEEFDFRELRDDGLLRRSVFEYTSFKPNVKVDPQLFTLQAVEIPAGTRFIDRRRGAAHRFQYKNGPGLTPRRP